MEYSIQRHDFFYPQNLINGNEKTEKKRVDAGFEIFNKKFNESKISSYKTINEVSQESKENEYQPITKELSWD